MYTVVNTHDLNGYYYYHYYYYLIKNKTCEYDIIMLTFFLDLKTLNMQLCSKVENLTNIMLQLNSTFSKEINDLQEEVAEMKKSMKQISATFNSWKFSTNTFSAEISELKTVVIEKRPLKEDENVIFLNVLIKTHELELPFAYLEDFLAFDDKLKENEKNVDKDWSEAEAYIAEARINLNIRQVLNPGQLHL